MSNDPEFSAVISLGGFCQVAYQIERRFGFRINSPFDWLVTPLASIGKIFANDGDDFGKAIRVINNGSTAVCCFYGVAYQHDYRRERDIDGKRRIIITAADMEQSRNKMLYKYNKLIDIISYCPPTLFIRMGGHHDSALPSPYIADPRPTTAQDLNDLCEAISNKFPTLTFSLAFVCIDKFTKLAVDDVFIDPRIRIFRIEGDVGDDWMGKEGQWQSLFDQYKFKLEQNSDRSARQFGGSQVQPEVLHA